MRVRSARALALLGAALTMAGATLVACSRGDSNRPGPTSQPTTTYSFSIVHGSLPRVLVMNREREARLVLRNEGFNSWQGERTFFFAPRWLTVRGELLVDEGFRTPIPDGVQPREEVEVAIRVRPPARYGLYRLQWDLLSKESSWFQNFDRTPEPERWVLVLPPLEFLLSVLLPCALLAAALLAARAARGSNGSPLARGYVGGFDMAWCAASLIGKPYLLYSELATKFWPGPKLITFSVVAALLLPLYFLPPRARRLALYLLAALGALVVATQIYYHRFFLDLASSVAILAGGQAGDLGESIGFLSQPTDLWLVLDLALALPVLLWISSTPSRASTKRSALVALALGLLTLPFLVEGARALSTGQLQSRRNLQNLRSVSVYGLYGFQILDAGARVLNQWNRAEPTAEELEFAFDWFDETRAARQATGPAAGVARGLNLIAIQVESMQEFVVDLDIDGAPVMPNLRRLRRRALEFPMVLDQTSRGRSSAGDFAVLTSMIPIGESVAYEFPKNDYYSIGRALAERSYSTVSAIPYKGSFWNRQVTHPAYGFDTNLFRSDFERLGPRVGWGINDRDFFGQMVPVLESLEEPFFAWLTTLSVHYPYESFPSQLASRPMGELEGTRLGNYLHGMRFFDRALGELFAALEAKGLLDRTVVTIWGDHGSGLVRDPDFVEFFGLDTPIKKFLFDRVPFLIWLPGDLAERRVEPAPAGQIDIAPTLLALLGVDPSNMALMGRNLLRDPIVGRVVHPQGKWLDGDYAYLSQFADTESACWSVEERRPVLPRRCRKGSLDAERQLEVVALMLEHDLQAELSGKLASSGPPS